MDKTKTVRQQIFAIFILGLLVIASPFSRVAQGANHSGEKEAVVLQLRWKHQFQFAGYYAAVEKGYYGEAGLDVKIVEGGLKRNTVEEVLSGRAHYGVSNAEILLHRLKKKPLVVLAAVFQHSPLVVLTRASDRVDSPQALIGKRLRMTKTSRDIELHAMFQNEGVPLDAILLEQGPYKKEHYFNPSFHGFSAYITNQPYYYEQRGIPYTVLLPRTYGIDFYGDCLFTSEEELRQSPERVKSFREASLKGWAYAMGNPDEIIELIISRYQSKKEREHLRFEAEKMKTLILPELVEIGHMNPGRWQHIAETFKRFDMVPPGYSLEGFIYHPDTHAGYTSDKRVIVIALVVSSLIGIVALALFGFNRQLQLKIRDRKRMEQAISQERDFASAILRWVRSIVVVVDLEGLIVIFNKEAEKCSGYTLEEVVQKPFWILLPDSEKDPVKGAFGDIKNGKPVRASTNHWLTKEGEERLIDWSYSALTGAAGSLEHILFTGRDMTEQSQVEDALQRSEEHHQDVLENLEEGYFEVDIAGNVTASNKSFLEIMGYSKSEFIGMNNREFMDKKTAKRVFYMYNSIFRTGKSETYPVYEVIRKDGERRTLEASVSILYDKDYNPVGFHGIVRDVTEKKRLEAMMIQTEKMMSVGGLAAGMAHEINNPLAIIVQGVQNIRRRFQVDQKANIKVADRLGLNLDLLNRYLEEREIDRMTESIQIAAKRAADIIKNMLRFSRKSDFMLSDINIETFIERTLDLASKDYDLLKKYDFRHITIDLQIENNIPVVVCMEQEIEQVLLNILTNAAQAMREHKPPTTDPKIIIRAGKEEEMVRLEIEDNGPGIPEDFRQRIFEPFFTTKPVGVGTGLGLSVSYMIITNNHKGSLEVMSEVGKGTRFIIRLPFTQEKASTSHAEKDQ